MKIPFFTHQASRLVPLSPSESIPSIEVFVYDEFGRLSPQVTSIKLIEDAFGVIEAADIKTDNKSGFITIKY